MALRSPIRSVAAQRTGAVILAMRLHHTLHRRRKAQASTAQEPSELLPGECQTFSSAGKVKIKRLPSPGMPLLST
jgi:hypothetical protein